MDNISPERMVCWIVNMSSSLFTPHLAEVWRFSGALYLKFNYLCLLYGDLMTSLTSYLLHPADTVDVLLTFQEAKHTSYQRDVCLALVRERNYSAA